MSVLEVGLAMEPGNAVGIFAHGELVGTAVRHGKGGWAVHVHGSTQRAADLDGVLRLLGLLSDHHQGGW
jgi:hypothetical protein